jgi:hypothetical protein
VQICEVDFDVLDRAVHTMSTTARQLELGESLVGSPSFPVESVLWLCDMTRPKFGSPAHLFQGRKIGRGVILEYIA